MTKQGFVFLIGAGPGDPGLFTIKGQRILGKADVVVYDRLIGQEILDFARPDAEMIYVGKESSRHALSQEDINRLLVDKARQGKVVARLKGGDPFVFGRGGEEALYVRQHGIDFEIVPGITSAVAVPAYAGIPVTHRDMTSSFAVITGHEKPGKQVSSIQWDKMADGTGTLVFLMGVENLESIVSNLLQAGRDAGTPVALIRRGTFPDQEVVSGTLGDITARVRQAGLQPPAIIVIGETVRLREELKWREKGRLWGARVVVTRARAQASELLQGIRDEGGEAIEFPAIEIVKQKDLSAFHEALAHLHRYTWIIFTSVNGVDIFLSELGGRGFDIRELKGIKIAAIGPATAARLTDRGLKLDLVPEEYRAEGIITGLRQYIKPADRILLPRAGGARGILPESLQGMGAVVDETIIYRARMAPRIDTVMLQDLKAGNFDYITFTSSSTVTNFVNMIGQENVIQINAGIKVACIGPITAATARDRGFTVDLMPDRYTIDALLQAIIADREARSHRP